MCVQHVLACDRQNNTGRCRVPSASSRSRAIRHPPSIRGPPRAAVHPHCACLTLRLSLLAAPRRARAAQHPVAAPRERTEQASFSKMAATVEESFERLQRILDDLAPPMYVVRGGGRVKRGEGHEGRDLGSGGQG